MNQRIGALQLRSRSCRPRTRRRSRSPPSTTARPPRAAPTRRRSSRRRRDRRRRGRRLRRGRRPPRRRRPQGRRAGGDRRLLGLAARADRLRGQELARGEEGRSPSSTRRCPSATPPTAIWVVPSEEQLPGPPAAVREINGDKLFVVFDPEQGRPGPPARLPARSRPRADGRRGRPRAWTTARCAASSSARSGRSRRAAGSASSSRLPPTASSPRARSWTRWRGA